MPLTLRVLSYRNQPVPGAASARFGDAGGSLGRSAENDLVLDDPGKYISRVHARVLCRGGGFYLEDMGSNPSLVNERPLGKGREIMLGHGDRVVIGDYQLKAELEEVAATEAPAFVEQPPLPDVLAGASILDSRVEKGGYDPLGLNLFSEPAARARAAESDHVSPELAALPAAPAPSAFAIPDDYDALADFMPRAAPPPASAPAPVESDGEVLRALLRGLGLPGITLNRPAAEVAESVGAMLREATAGTIDVLMARALTKKESRMDVTMLAVRENNPLKFFPNADGALTQMLTGAMAGYLPPVQAMAGAFDDLRAHELAVIAGMRAALGAVLHRFDPAMIEARLAVPTVMDKMLASNRKAKMWDRLVELYGEIAREADDDLQRLFGEKFSEAYEDQVARLRLAKKGST
ncbi:MAG TPA: type VI secretion system-associated FHA domain protein TagH [Telluria sp.]|nr:type VI secretion system-associated FHA domain protein TagH [Telluria sp.]